MREDTANSPYPFDSGTVHTAAQANLVARALATPFVNTCEEIAAFRAIDDKEAKAEIARTMLNRLTGHRKRFLRVLRDQSALDHHLLRACAGGDQEELAKLGFDTRYAWLDDVLAAMISGGPFVEIETVTTYAAVHADLDGKLRFQAKNLPPEEKTGIMLGALFRDISQGCPNVRQVTDVDDIHNYSAGTHFSKADQDQYVVSISQVFTEAGMHLPYDAPGRNYLIVPISRMYERVDELMAALRSSGHGTVETRDSGDVVFQPTERLIRLLALRSEDEERELRRSGIMLRKNGAVTSHALTAASFLHPINREILHLIMRDTRMEHEQNKVYALTRAIGVKSQDTYNNVFYDSQRHPPELIALLMCETLMGSLENFLRLVSLYRDWEHFDSAEYAERNYGGDFPLPEDRDLIATAIAQLEKADLPVGGVRTVADIGSGPNFYPSMMLAPYVASGGEIRMLDYSSRNREFISQFLSQPDGQPSMWDKFEDLMVSLGGQKYAGALQRARSLSQVAAGSIYNLPVGEYDIVTSYFVPESITISRREFRQALRSLSGAVKRDGLLIAAHMVGSLGYYAGQENRFPAIRLSIDDLAEAYRDLDLEFSLYQASESDEKCREGYHGMAVVVARPRS